MAAIHELLKQVSDSALRARLTEEINRVTQNKKFGLVFEEHMPECTPLYGIRIKRGATVAKKANKINDTYTVITLDADTAVCRNKSTGETEEIPVNDLVAVAQFGEPIFPCLEPIDRVENAPESDLWHTLIEADNYHALQLLEYLYAGKVDCIYIDPPYNTGARDWKYNNDYVDGSDSYRHSKWLSMMKKRLKLAKRLLNPEDSVLIVTIDEKEYLHLGCLLEEMFPEARMQMVSSVINPNGSSRKDIFSRSDEYIFFLFIGSSSVSYCNNDMLHPIKEKQTRWCGLIRTGTNGRRVARPNLFYPVFFYKENGKFAGVGNSLPLNMKRDEVTVPDGCFAVFPLNKEGGESTWGIQPSTFVEKHNKGYIKFGPWVEGSSYRSISHLQDGMIKAFESGQIESHGKDADGAWILGVTNKPITAMTTWVQDSHNAGVYGSSLLKSIFKDIRFSFPKSVYAVVDALRFVSANKPNALIVDFFAGSGTTLHAVNLLNAEDGGHRRCIMVTNNEVSEAEAKNLTQKGYHPGDEEWERLGIARYVTWPRTVCSIEGHDVNGNPLKGNYLSSDVPMADGFAANCEFFKLGFMDRDMVSLGRQFREILPLLWMKSGAVGKRPETEDEEPIMLVLPENHFAVLVEEAAYAAFAREVRKYDSIDTVYFVTNSESAYHEMSADIGIKNTYQLYRDYIDNFVIGARRDRT